MIITNVQPNILRFECCQSFTDHQVDIIIIVSQSYYAHFLKSHLQLIQ